MSDTPFTNREINQFMQDIKESLHRIENQTTKTNGRVTKLEWKVALIFGGLTVVALIVVPQFLDTIRNGEPSVEDLQTRLIELEAEAKKIQVTIPE